jgi:N-acetyl-alpha-D-glucosaminyl L-malate synthase BshA
MNIGIACYASVGGSGVVASELARCLADRGHRTHVISSDTPFRLRDSNSDVRFHRVETPGYPVFREPQYLLALTNRLVQVARAYRLDIIHAHYAIPHAAAAYLARQILASAGNAPRTITTLHGTDVTILGADPSYRETVAFCIDQSDAVTAVSASLREDTKREMPVKSDIVVIPNFLDCGFHRRTTDPQLRSRFCAPDEMLVIHISNLRPVKQVDAVARVFAQIRKRMAARLLIVGEGPDLGRAERLIDELGITAHVELVGEARDVVGLLSVSDLFLLPSLQESFGLSALEAMACGVPVVASNVGGLHEVIDDGITGFLHNPSDIQGMAASGVRLLTDPDLHARVARDSRRTVQKRFCRDLVVPQYEAVYTQILEGQSQ